METWTLKQKHKNKLMIIEIDYLRRLARISIRDKIKNSIIRDTMQITKNIINEIEEMQLRCYGHVMRRENKLNKETFFRKAQGKRKRENHNPHEQGKLI